MAGNAEEELDAVEVDEQGVDYALEEELEEAVDEEIEEVVDEVLEEAVDEGLEEVVDEVQERHIAAVFPAFVSYCPGQGEAGLQLVLPPRGRQRWS